MYLVIDNYDSFVYNMVSYFKEENRDVMVRKNDKVTIDFLDNIIENGELEAIIISSGSNTLDETEITKEIISKFYKEIPILGISLGHEIIGSVFGAKIIKCKKPMHGKVSSILTTGQGLFAGIERRFNVTRYHSLVIDRKTLSKDIVIDAISQEDDEIMAIRHIEYPLFGFQFHPEAVLTENGHEMIKNFIKICDEFKKEKEENL